MFVEPEPSEDLDVGVKTAPPQPGGPVLDAAAVNEAAGAAEGVVAEEGRLPKLDCCGTKGGRPFPVDRALEFPKFVAGSRLIL